MPVAITLLCALLEGGLVENETVNKTSDLCVIMTVSYVYKLPPHNQLQASFRPAEEVREGIK